MLPAQWIIIATDILTIVMGALGFVDHTFHTALLTNPITLSILTFLGAVGIRQTVVANNAANTTPPPKA